MGASREVEAAEEALEEAEREAVSAKADVVAARTDLARDQAVAETARVKSDAEAAQDKADPEAARDKATAEAAGAREDRRGCRSRGGGERHGGADATARADGDAVCLLQLVVTACRGLRGGPAAPCGPGAMKEV